MLKTLIVDDDQANINTLQTMIEMYCPQIDVCGTAKRYNRGLCLNPENAAGTRLPGYRDAQRQWL